MPAATQARLNSTVRGTVQQWFELRAVSVRRWAGRRRNSSAALRDPAAF